MTKIEVQKRVLKEGKPIDLDLFNWDENTDTFSSNEHSLVIDFNSINYCNFKTGSHCTFNTDSNCTFKTGYDCTFNTGSNCTFKTGYDCTFKTGSECTFNTGSECTFNTGSDCVIVRKDKFLVIQPQENEIIRLNPYNIPGFLSKEKDDDKFYLNRDKSLGEHIIVDDILSNVLSKKGNIFKVKNYNDEHISYIIKDGDIYSHGKTIKEAKDSLMYKISNRDTSIYTDLTLKSIITKEQAIKMYRTITGACEYGTRYFVENNKSRIEEFTINDVIQLTEGQFGNEEFKKFFSI